MSSTVTRLYLVRHAATMLTAENRCSGAVGVELSGEGRAQAMRLGAAPRGEDHCGLFQPALPDRRTAQLIAGQCGLTAEPREGLQEISHGRWEGLTRAEVEQRFPGEYEAWEEDPFTFAPEGGESGVSVLARALPVIREIVTSHPGERVLVVSHKATLRLLISSLLGFDARGYRDREPGPPEMINGRRATFGARDSLLRSVNPRRPGQTL